VAHHPIEHRFCFSRAAADCCDANLASACGGTHVEAPCTWVCGASWPRFRVIGGGATSFIESSSQSLDVGHALRTASFASKASCMDSDRSLVATAS